MKRRRSLPWTIAASLVLHGVAYASLGTPPVAQRVAPRQMQLRFEVSTPRAVAPLEPPKPEPPKPEPPQPEPPRPKSAGRPAALPETQPAAPASEPPPDSGGVTLAASGDGPGFAMPLGSGGDLTPARVPSAPSVKVAAPVVPVPPRLRAEPRIVSVADLSTRPAPPPLGAVLEQNYPADARRRGSSGSAKVRARIDPDGVVRQVTLLEESAPGFGSACSRTLGGSRWGPPKDKAGRPVATEIRYTCRFVVQR